MNRIIKSGNNRFRLYVATAVVMAAAVIATLIMMDKITIDDVNQWIALVVALVVAILGLGQSVVAAFNTDRVIEPGTGKRAKRDQ